jgi:hypothetical protein
MEGSNAMAVLATIAREVLAKLLRSIPDYVIKAMTAFLRWYFRLGMIGMILATSGIVVAVILVGPILGVPAKAQDDMRGLLEPVVVLLFLVAIFLGMIRGGRGRRS